MVFYPVSKVPDPQLLKAQELFLIGRYPESLVILESIDKDPAYAHMAVDRASADLLRARNLMHLEFETEAGNCIASIPEVVFDYNPALYSDRCSVSGILKRREARRFWKMGSRERALVKANEAIMEFNLAEVAAQHAGEYGNRLFFNSCLNKQYARGLLLAINGSPPSEYEPLVTEAIIAEHHSRQNMTETNRDYISGTAIIADLALGATLDVDHVSLLSGSTGFASAFHAIFGWEKLSWPEHILSQCRGIPYKYEGKSRAINFIASPGASQDSLAKSLILGCKLLLREENIDANMLVAYAVDMQLCAGLLKRNGNIGAAKKIYDVINIFPAHIYNDSRYPMHSRIFY